MQKWIIMLIMGVSVLAASGCAGTVSSGQPSAAEQASGSTQSPPSNGEEGSGGKEGPGSLSHAEDAQFCASHECIANFPNGHGEVVECGDGEWSHSGGISGACSDHGGVKGVQERSGSGDQQTEGAASEQSSGEKEGPGSISHAEDAQFCSSHTCIANFPDGRGTVVECFDGEWSHSGGLSGACSDHGGENASSASTHQSEEPEPANNNSASSEALGTLDKYWSYIRDHGFAQAYSYLAPGAAGLSESQFIASEEHAGIENAQFHGNVAEATADSATVNVQSLITNDAQFGCRTWSGSYSLTRDSGGWRIERAALTPHSC